MLPPLYFSRLEEVEDAEGNLTIQIAQTPLTPGISYSLLGYSRFDIYTLVKWRHGYEDEYFTGENLWRDQTPIATDGGALSLYTPPPATPGMVPPEDMSVWSRVDANIGSYGVPVNVAIALRDPANTVYF